MAESTTTPGDDHVRSTLWAWVAVFFIILFTLTVSTGAVLLTPGNPFSCNIPNPGGWFLCAWAREFVANAVLLTAVLSGTTVSLALVVGFTRALIRETRD